MKKTVEILENNQKEIPKNTKGVVYILRSFKDIDGIYRFGQTADFKRRLNNYNSHNSDKMAIVKIYETKNIEKVESCVIAQIKELRYKKRKDFYQINLKTLTKIIKECCNLTLKFRGSINNNLKKNSKKNSKTNSKKSLDGGSQINYYMYLQK